MSAPDAPSGVVTFLFTDVEGSTRRWESDPDAMRAALAAHEAVLRNAIEAHGGFLFKHTGDGVCAAFASPRSAVDAAVTAQRKLELPVRMGIATGEAELRDGDYLGAVLNRAARVMAAGHGGQILVADSTAGLLSGVEFVDFGPRRLRDVSTPVRLFQVRGPGLATDFPPLKAHDSSPGNLRPQTTSFVGREAETAEIAAAVRAHRLVTLTGVGGVGKTRLATEVAADLADEFPDGVWLFELASVADPGAVPDAVAAVLGILRQPGKSVNESVAAALEGRIRLLVFDNCEHVLGATADLVEAILEHSTAVRILATSREGLSLADEQLWPVPSLDVEAGADSAAVALFLERAHSVAPRSVVDEPAAVEICRRLDGIPLAIELAASRMASMTAMELRDRLDHRFRLLVGSRRGLERHQTLRHAVEWSYDLLDEAEKSVLERCSVFAGGFDLESACAVAGSDHVDEYAVLDRLDALVRKSLLAADVSAGRTRFSMLETIRQFAEERLVAAGNASEVRAFHARYFGHREGDIMALWDSPRQQDAYAWFTTELANLRTAFRWATDQGDLDIAAAIATYGSWLGMNVENYEPIAWAEELIEPARAVDHPRLAALYLMASQCYVAGRTDAALRYCEMGQEIVGGGRGEVPFGIEGWLGDVYMAIGQPERWVQACRAQLASVRDSHAFTKAGLVIGLTVVGSSDEAMAVASELIEVVKASQSPLTRSFALLAFGLAFRDADPDRALNALRRGMAIARDTGNRGSESHLASVLTRLEAERGDPLAALDYVTVAIRNYHDAANTTMMCSALASLAALLDRLGRYAPAARLTGFASNPFSAATVRELATAMTHLRRVLGDDVYDLLVQEGEAMTPAAIANYAYEQIDEARTQFEDQRLRP